LNKCVANNKAKTICARNKVGVGQSDINSIVLGASNGNEGCFLFVAMSNRENGFVSKYNLVDLRVGELNKHLLRADQLSGLLVLQLEGQVNALVLVEGDGLNRGINPRGSDQLETYVNSKKKKKKNFASY